MLNQHPHVGAGVTGLVMGIPRIDQPTDMPMPGGVGVAGDGVGDGAGGSGEYAVTHRSW